MDRNRDIRALRGVFDWQGVFSQLFRMTRAGKIFWSIAVLQIALICFLPLISGDAPASVLNHYWDDFFYYLQIARNIASDLRSTFDGTNPTNGYHPLWMVVIVVLCLLFDPTALSFHLALAAVIGTASLLTAHAAFLVARNAFGLAPIAASSIALIGQAYHLNLAYSGMEIALAIPLMFGFVIAGHRFVDRPSSRHAALWAGVGSLCILSRLDTALFVFLVASLVFCATPLKEVRTWLRPSIVGGAAAGILPLLLYVVINVLVFGTVAPVSGQAKQLAAFPVLNLKPLLYVVSAPVPLRTVFPALVILVGFACWRRIRPTGSYWRAAIGGMLVFPVVHLLAVSAMSDWIIWPWYLYPLALAPVAGLAAFARNIRRTILVGLAAILIVGLFAETANRNSLEWTVEPGITESSLAIARFAAEKDGTYAMGDRAGRVGFLLPNRVVQLEGLVNSPAFLDRIRREEDLRQVLASLNVQYYIGTAMPQRDGCYVGYEPKMKQAGTKSPRMTGTFCEPPIFEYVDFRGVRTLIFEIGQNSG